MPIMLLTLLHYICYLRVTLNRRKNGRGLGIVVYGTEEYCHVVAIFVVDKEALGEVFLLVIRSSTVSNISPLAPYVSSFICCPYQKGKRDKPKNLPIWDVLSEVGEYCTERYFQLFHFCIGLRTLYIVYNSWGRRHFCRSWRLRVCKFIGWKSLVPIFANMTQHSPSYL
jgi:hypothetical protein